MAFQPRRVLITGGAGFIGSALVRHVLAHGVERVVVLDALTYAGKRENLPADARLELIVGDVCDRAAVEHALTGADTVFHLAAETHVDRSIDAADVFVRTNVAGTFTLLDAAQRAWGGRDDARFLHVSTDEVYGALGPTGRFSEDSPYAPNSPYAASKAAADHLVRSYVRTHGLPAVTAGCCNNYGPRQLPEKLIPLVITRALAGEPLPVYGEGKQVREWLHVEDHCAGLWAAVTRGAIGERYNFGSGEELPNLALVERLCDLVGAPRSLIRFVADRKGHDFRYALDCAKVHRELGWRPAHTLAEQLPATVRWYAASRPA